VQVVEPEFGEAFQPYAKQVSIKSCLMSY
jgi:hypothetical protein